MFRRLKRAALGCLLALEIIGLTLGLSHGAGAGASPVSAVSRLETYTVPATPVREGWAELARTPPRRDLLDLARRFRPGSLPIQGGENSQPQHTGETFTFTVTNVATNKLFTVPARLVHIDGELLFYAQEGYSATPESWQQSARAFHNKGWPSLKRFLGAKDTDPPITVLVARIPGVQGYYSSSDNAPRSAYPASNEREMVYINGDAVRPGTAEFDAVLVHEFAHLQHYRLRGADETWISEGAAELVMRLAGYSPSAGYSQFANRPSVQLTGWAAQGVNPLPHYGAAHLFLSYLLPRTGSYTDLMELLVTPGRGSPRFDSYLASRLLPAGFDEMFADWTVTNIINSRLVADGAFAYSDLGFRLPISAMQRPVSNRDYSTPQYAAAYYSLEVPAGSWAMLQFTGTSTTSLLANDAYSGRYQWWSNRGDSINPRLTRSLDLTGVTGDISLDFWVWYDLEDGFDYAYVSASVDDGQTWSALPGRHTTERNDLLLAYGPGYTGRSGREGAPTWVPESVDLSAFAGHQILLRFEAVTDDAYNTPGFAWDDLCVTAIGWCDDAEVDNGWMAEGFLRIDNRIPQTYAVQIIKRNGSAEGISVERLLLDDRQSGQVDIVADTDRPLNVIMVVAPMAPLTTEFARYAISISGL